MDKQSDKEIKKILKIFKVSEKNNTYKCNNCKDTGYVVLKEKAVLCNCKNIKKDNLPVKFKNLMLSNFNLSFYPKDIIDSNKSSITYYDRAKKLYDDSFILINKISNKLKKIKGLFITGPVGSGKTFLSAIIFNELKNKNINVEFHIVPEFLEKIKNNLFNDNYNENFLDKVKKIEVLILDDLGVHNYTQWTINQLYMLFNYRLNNLLPTIINSNYTLNEIENLLDNRIASRLVELCDGYILMSNQDIRFKKAKNKNK